MTALIVIDMQTYFASTATPLLPVLNPLIDTFHSSGMVVVYTQHGHTPEQLAGGSASTSQLVRFWTPEGSLARFSPQWGLVEGMVGPIEGDVRVQDKDTYDSFLGTHLEETLKAQGVKRVLITGVLTNFCCETTARSAFNRGFETWTIADACGAKTSDMHLTSLRALAAGFGLVLTAQEAVERLGLEWGGS